MPVDGERQGAAKTQVAHQTAPNLIVCVEIWIEGELTTRPCPPKPHLIFVTLFALFQKSVIVETQIPGLEIALARARLGGDDLAVRNRHDYAIDIGKLMAGFVH